MLEQIADELYAVLQEKDLTCEVEAEDNLNIYGDPDKLARVFDNILRNAIAYCYAGTKIRIEAHKKKNDIEIIFPIRGNGFQAQSCRQYLKNSTGWMIPDPVKQEGQAWGLPLPKKS